MQEYACPFKSKFLIRWFKFKKREPVSIARQTNICFANDFNHEKINDEGLNLVNKIIKRAQKRKDAVPDRSATGSY